MLPFNEYIAKQMKRHKLSVVRITATCRPQFYYEQLQSLKLKHVRHIKITIPIAGINVGTELVWNKIIRDVNLEFLKSLAFTYDSTIIDVIPFQDLQKLETLSVTLAHTHLQVKHLDFIPKLGCLKTLNIKCTRLGGIPQHFLSLASETVKEVSIDNNKQVEVLSLNLPNCEIYSDGYMYGEWVGVLSKYRDTYRHEHNAKDLLELLYEGCPKLVNLDEFDISSADKTKGFKAWKKNVKKIYKYEFM